MVFGLVGCDGSKNKDESVKPAPDALAKPPELSKPSAADALPGGEPAKQRPASEAVRKDDAADDGAGDVAGDAPPEQAEPKKRASTKRDRGRKRASTSPKEENAKSGSVDSEADEPATVPLKVKRIQFSESIAAREPVDPEETFAGSEVDKLYAFIELTNETKQKTKVVVRFIPPSGSSSKVTLDVGDKSRWRTWALRRGVKAVGTWTVVVSDAEGEEIGRRTFEVTE